MTECYSVCWQKSLIQSRQSVQDVIRNLDETGFQIALVVGEANQLLGTVTDGDVRRGLLRGMDMHSSVDSIMFLTPMVVTEDIGRELVLNLMRANKIHQLPVVDDQRRVVGLHLWDEIVKPSSRSNFMVIMAGGFGKRLHPYTIDCPKPMLPVADKPILEHILERAISEGFRDFVISLHYLGNVIQDYFGDGSRLNVNIEYLNEETPLGTAGAISLLSRPVDIPFIVTNGDVLTDVRYGEMLDFHLQHRADATMAVRPHEWQHPYGVVRTEGIRIIGFEEKPVYRTHVNAGIYVLASSVFDVLQTGQNCDMPTLFMMLQESEKKTIAYPMHEPWLDIGRPEDLKRVNEASIESGN